MVGTLIEHTFSYVDCKIKSINRNLEILGFADTTRYFSLKNRIMQIIWV